MELIERLTQTQLVTNSQSDFTTFEFRKIKVGNPRMQYIVDQLVKIIKERERKVYARKRFHSSFVEW